MIVREIKSNEGPPNSPAPAVGVPDLIVPPPPYTVLLAMNAYGLTGSNQYQKLATEVFIDDFEICKYMSNEDISEIFKTFSGLTSTQGQIKIIPAQKNKIKAFTKCVKYRFRLIIDPIILPFSQADIAELLRRSKTHQLFVSKLYTISMAENPLRLTTKDKWD